METALAIQTYFDLWYRIVVDEQGETIAQRIQQPEGGITIQWGNIGIDPHVLLGYYHTGKMAGPRPKISVELQTALVAHYKAQQASKETIEALPSLGDELYATIDAFLAAITERFFPTLVDQGSITFPRGGDLRLALTIFPRRIKSAPTPLRFALTIEGLRETFRFSLWPSMINQHCMLHENSLDDLLRAVDRIITDGRARFARTMKPQTS